MGCGGEDVEPSHHRRPKAVVFRLEDDDPPLLPLNVSSSLLTDCGGIASCEADPERNILAPAYVVVRYDLSTGDVRDQIKRSDAMVPPRLSLAFAASLMAVTDQGVTSVSAVTSGRNEIKLSASLASKVESYHVGEPVHLTITVRNEGDEAVKGFFPYGSGGSQPEIHFGPRGGQQRLFALHSKTDDLKMEAYNRAQKRVTLPPGGEVTGSIYLLVDGQTGRLALESPGEYEVQVVLHPLSEDREWRVVSARLGISAQGVPAGEGEAFAEYESQKMAALMWSMASLAEGGDARELGRAEAFLSRHPHSIYAGHVRKVLDHVLESLVMRGVATPEQRALRERLARPESAHP